MNKIFCLLFSLPLMFSNLEARIDLSDDGSSNNDQQKIIIPQLDNSSELDQRALFDKTRRGVVAIKTTAHLVIDRGNSSAVWNGTGFIVDIKKGLVVTNAHVAGRHAVCSYEIKFGNGKKATAKLQYIDPCYDFAVLSVDSNDIPTYVHPLKISNEKLKINTEVYSMGNSANNEFSIYRGYIFDTKGILWLYPIAEQSFQFSGLTVPGASGSPVLNNKGEVVGLLYGGKLVSGAALPISYVSPVVDSLKDGKIFHRYFHGLILDYESLQEAIKADNLPEQALDEYEKEFPESNDKVLFVSRKLSYFGAESISIEPGDIIWKVDGELIGPNLERIDEIVQDKAGKTLKLTVYRHKKRMDLEVPTFEISDKSNFRILSFAGAVFFENTNEMKVNLGKTLTNVNIEIAESDSPFMEIFSKQNNILKVGAQITAIDGKPIASLDDVRDVIENLFKKQVFEVKFIEMAGDCQESSIIVKYSPEFAEAVLYTFDQDSKAWKVENIKNPKRDK